MESYQYITSQNEINNTAMLHRSILKIRKELLEFISECVVEPGKFDEEDPTTFKEDPVSLITKVTNLKDYEILDLYIRYTFDNEWRGIFVDEL